MLQHFVITRLGLGVYSETWYARMLDIFEAITLASLSRQTSQDFTWLIAFDTNIPPAAHARLQELLSAPNYHAVPIDVTELRRSRLGGMDWVFEYCQEYLLEHGLVDDPAEYVITSLIDADDAWNRDVVATINGYVASRLPEIRRREESRANTIRHSAGTVITFPRGFHWYLPLNAVAPLTYSFLGTAIFVAARFSCGVSAASMRHHYWPSFGKALEFEVVELEPDRPMWIYLRHNRSSESWNADNAAPLDAATTELFRLQFGVDLRKVEQLRSRFRADELALTTFAGLSFSGQQDRLYRIAALNRQIDALERQLRKRSEAIPGETNRSLQELLARKQAERKAFIDAFRKTGRSYYP